MYVVSIVSPIEAIPFLERGWKAADLHVHSNRSYDVPNAPSLDPAAILATATQIGMTYRTLTDHDTLTNHGDIHGVELTIDDSEVGHTVHFNIYDLDEQQFSSLLERRDSASHVIRYCNQEELPLTYNHPYWFKPDDEMRIRRDDSSARRAIQSIEAIAHDVDVIEYNAKRTPRSNDLAITLAHTHGKGLIGATDTHTGDVGLIHTIAPGDTFREWWSNVASRKARIVDTAPGSHLRIEASHYYTHLLRKHPEDQPTGVSNLVGILATRFLSAGQNSLSDRITRFASSYTP